ncbi:MAG: ShlB/FhaC/HecB family hemolysin secretion/activation protein [Candidatus Accumulibacter sp.]|nr:ShlB/FhaC/HecB family hemolysin secretion/activation protein [Accumulibacter sp.]
MHTRQFIALSLSGLLIGVTTSGSAQTPPDAGALQRETQRRLQAPRPADDTVRVPSARPMNEHTQASRVTVRRLIIDGATLLPVAELQAQIADLVDQSLTFAELEHAAQRIAAYYREHGWFVRVYLPPQDVTDGTVRLQVVEGRYEGSRLENQGRRANGEAVRRVVTHRLKVGEPLSAADLERGLLLANDLPGIRANGLLKAGETHASTRLLVHVDDTPFITGDLGLNNHGVKSTGVIQAVGGLALNNLAGIGDQLSLRALAAENIYSLALRYGLPLGTDGWRLGLHLTTLSYRLGDRYKNLDAEGQAHTGGVSLSYPIIRRSSHNLYFSTGYERRRYEDDSLGAPVHRHDVDALTLGLTGELRDSLGGGGLSWGGLQLTRGRLHLRDVAGDPATDAAGPRTQGEYSKLGLQLNRQQALGGSGWQFLTALAGQWSKDNLGSSERFSLGGPDRVRAYPVNEANGDQGLLVKLELQRELGQGWQVIAFYDTGRVRQHAHTWAGWQGGGKPPNSYRLSGAGVGLNWRHDGWQLAASAAAPIDGNPGADANGHNGDGSKSSSTRYWLSLSRVF